MSSDRHMHARDVRPPFTGVGGSDCVVLVKEVPEGPGVIARQVIEGLRFDAQGRRVDIWLILELETGEHSARTRVVHRGDVDAWLEPFSPRPGDPELSLLARLYSGRIVQNRDDPRAVLFYPRINCLAVAQGPIEVSLEGPGKCFADGRDRVPLLRECPMGAFPSFTSFLLPEMPPKGRDLFVLRLQIQDPSYAYLVEQHPWFSVSSYTRLLRDIVAFDVANASPEAQNLYRSHIAPAHAHIVPKAYDIVLFQELGDPIQVMDGSVCILPVRPQDDELARQVLWFFGQPASEFYLELAYLASRPTVSPRNCFVISASPPRHEAACTGRRVAGVAPTL